MKQVILLATAWRSDYWESDKEAHIEAENTRTFQDGKSYLKIVLWRDWGYTSNRKIRTISHNHLFI